LIAEQFDALAELLRLREGVSSQAARLVLVGGLSQAEAGRQTGLSTAGVGNAVRRVRRGLELAKLAARS
jgi:DNA-directed RNA polymerase specialized sigma24 family protein